jgi:hypothetical protein
MGNLESRIEKLEQAIGNVREPPSMTLQFIRPDDKFCCGYLRLKTGEEITQRDDESDADFVARAKAAGFQGASHEQS